MTDQHITLRPHPTIPDLYVSSDGRVFHEQGVSPGYEGYHMIWLNRSRLGIRRHVLVAETYLGPKPHPRSHVRHRNGVPGDDHPNNLVWGSAFQNGQDTAKHGRTTVGERNPQARLTTKDVVEIRERKAAGESPTALAAEFGVSAPSVHDILRGRTWKHVGGPLNVADPRFTRRRKTDAKTAEAIRTALLSGEQVADVAERFNVSMRLARRIGNGRYSTD